MCAEAAPAYADHAEAQPVVRTQYAFGERAVMETAAVPKKFRRFNLPFVDIAILLIALRLLFIKNVWLPGLNGFYLIACLGLWPSPG
jgi:hypothetical protein